jgi:molecular chaperone DnaK (HSP70)
MTTIAIDFGTSNTVVSILEVNSQIPKNLRFAQISRLYHLKNILGETWQIPVIPTVVFINQNQELILGKKVRDLSLNLSQPQRFFKNFKRDLAANFQGPPRYIDGNFYDAKIISELFIKEIWKYLKQHNIEPTEAIFTVPVGAYENYLNWFLALANKLNIPQVKLIDESTAAALGYAVKNPNSLVLVIDFGGGTLDLSLVRTLSSPGTDNENRTQIFKAEVLAKSDAYLGGEDIDIWIVEDYLRRQKLSREKIGEMGWQNLLEIAEKLKIRLSHEEVVQEMWLDEESFISYELELSRDKLTEILENQQLLEQLRYALDEVLHLASGKGIKKSDIQQVLLVGGTCFIPAIKQLIISYFGQKKVKFHKPFDAVCHGALALSKFQKIDDYLHHTYVIRLWDPSTKNYTYFSLFAKGSPYPCQRKEPLFLQVALTGQTEIKLDMGELGEISEAEVSYDEYGQISPSYLQNKFIYRPLEMDRPQVCIGYLDPPGEVGIDRISVDFEVDENRILLATVKDLLTNKILINQQAIAKLK